MAESTTPDGGTDRDDDGAAPPSSPEDTSTRSSIVGVGASAGGLSALSAFFSALPPDTGLSFAVVQHLSPDAKSRLSDILRRTTGVDAVDAEDGMRVEPNRVYVLPPNRFISLEDGHWRLTLPPRGTRLPIDYLFRSLATACEERAAAVVLSGTGTDGTLGIQAIKAANGVVIAQDPETADYPDMPRSAIDTDLVDLILAPDEMIPRLTRHARELPAVVPGETAESPAHEDQLRAILDLVRERCGHDLSLYKSSTIARRVARRMVVHDVATYADYRRLLQEQPGEIDDLFNDLLIRVSAFFRDPEAFEALAREVIPKLFETARAEEPVRVWVAGCSTGEEAYSLAILIREWLEGENRTQAVQIFATDIDGRALKIAREGRYPANIEADVSVHRLRRHFTARDNQYIVRKHIRDMVLFAEQSIVRDPPFSRVDLVSCRNVLIYMGSELQQRLLPLLHYALRPGGYLFLGSSESVGHANDLFAVRDRTLKIFQRQGDNTYNARHHELPMFLSPRSHASARSKPASGAPAAAQDLTELCRRALLRDHTPPSVVINLRNEAVYFNGETGAFLAPASGAPSMDLMRMVRKKFAGSLRVALQHARAWQEAVHSDVVRIPRDDSGEAPARFLVAPLAEPEAPEGAMVVLLRFLDADEATAQAPPHAAESDRVEALQLQLASKEEALQASIEELETSNEELQSSNEELQSSNEELQSTNEELETSREELQAVNEELHTVNSELEDKVEQLARARDDISNLLASSAIGIVYLDEQLRIQRYTSAVTDIVPLIDGDIGRPLDDIGHRLHYPDLAEDLDEVIASGNSRERQVEGRDGRLYLARVSPYRISQHEARGAVLTFVDLSDRERLTLLDQLRGALDHSPSTVIILDLDGRIVHVNRGFVRMSGCEASAILGEKAGAAGLTGLDEADDSALQAARAGHTWSGNVRYCRGDGDGRTLSATVAPIYGDGNDTPAHAVAYMDEQPA